MSGIINASRWDGSFDYQCDDALKDCLERAAALDGWLVEQLGEPWQTLRSAILPSDGIMATHPRRLWAFFLCAFELAHEASQFGAAQASATARAWASAPPTPTSPGASGISALPAHPALQRALDSSWRSDIHGGSLRALDRLSSNRLSAGPMADALEVLRESGGTGWDLVRNQCAAVAFVTRDPPLAEQAAVSLTVKPIPGIVILSEVPLLMLIEGLVHEAAHLWLNGVERVRSLYGDLTLRTITPLRKDPRPVSGLLHQAWVLTHLSLLYDELAASNHPTLAAERARIEFLRRAHRRDLGLALDTLEGTPGALAPMGTAFVARMRTVVGPLPAQA